MKNSGAILMPVPWKDELKEVIEGPAENRHTTCCGSSPPERSGTVNNIARQNDCGSRCFLPALDPRELLRSRMILSFTYVIISASLTRTESRRSLAENL